MGDQFPAGLRVLVVDDDRTCLAILKRMLLRCAYDVTTCGMARLALAMLRENKERFDVVLSDVCMPDMDGFKLLELVGLEMDLPVIMMSANGETSLVMKGITHGACDYLLKPIRITELKNIWQHVIRRKRNILKDADNSEHERLRRKSDEGDSAPAGASAAATASKKRKEAKDEEEEVELDMDDSSTLKKPRVVWSVELHQQFVTAVNQLGIDKAVPKRILELMNVQGLTRENVASHLQKYRLYLKRLGAVTQHQNSVTMSMTIGGEPSYNPVESLQSHPIISPGSSQALAALRSAYLRTICSPSDPVSNGVVEPPVLLVRPRVPPSNHRNLLLGVGDLEQPQQSQVLSTAQIRQSPQEGLVQSNPIAEQILQQHPQQPQQIQPVLQSYSQKQPENFIDYSAYNNKDGELCSRNTTLNDGLISRSFNGGGIVPADGISVLMNGGMSKPNIPGIVKCEEVPFSSVYGVANHQASWQEQQGSVEFIHDSLVPSYNSSTDNTFDRVGNEMLLRQDYVSRIIGNGEFKVKLEQPYDYSVPPNQYAQVHDDVVGLSSSHRQEQESGFFENDLCLDGYPPGNNLYVK